MEALFLALWAFEFTRSLGTSIGSETTAIKDLGLEVKVIDPSGNEKAWFNRDAFLILQGSKQSEEKTAAGSKAKGGKTTPA